MSPTNCKKDECSLSEWRGKRVRQVSKEQLLQVESYTSRIRERVEEGVRRAGFGEYREGE